MVSSMVVKDINDEFMDLLFAVFLAMGSELLLQQPAKCHKNRFQELHGYSDGFSEHL